MTNASDYYGMGVPGPTAEDYIVSRITPPSFNEPVSGTTSAGLAAGLPQTNIGVAPYQPQQVQSYQNLAGIQAALGGAFQQSDVQQAANAYQGYPAYTDQGAYLAPSYVEQTAPIRQQAIAPITDVYPQPAGFARQLTPEEAQILTYAQVRPPAGSSAYLDILGAPFKPIPQLQTLQDYLGGIGAELGPSALSVLAGPLGVGYDVARRIGVAPEIPYVTPGAEIVGRTTAEAFTPTTPAELALIAAPAAYQVGRGIRAGLPVASALRRGALTAAEQLFPTPNLNAPLEAIRGQTVYHVPSSLEDAISIRRTGIRPGTAVTPDRQLAEAYAQSYSRQTGQELPVMEFRARPTQLEKSGYYYRTTEPLGVPSPLGAGERGAVTVPGGEPPAPSTGGVPDVFETARAKLTNLVGVARPLPGETEELRHVARRQRVAAGYRALEAGGRTDEAYRAALAAQAGELPRAAYEGARVNMLPEELDALRQKLSTSNLRFYEEINAKGALDKVLDGRLTELTPSEMALLDRVFGPELVESIAKKQPLDWWEEAAGFISLPQTIAASSDLSAPFRQGLVLGAAHPTEWFASWKPMIDAGLSEKTARAVNDSLRQMDWVVDHVNPDKAELAFGRVGGHLSEISKYGGEAEKEAARAFMGRSRITQAARAIPTVRGSERAYITFLNQLRARVYATEAEKMWQAGVRDRKQYEALAKVINHASGWSEISVGQIKAGRTGINAFFAPRLMLSRFQVALDPLIQPGSLFKPSARQLAAKNLAGAVANDAALITFIATLTGASLTWNPLDTDFGKLVYGKPEGKQTRIDLLGGFSPMIRTVARVIHGGEAISSSGAEYKVNPADEIAGFFRNKESPIAGLVTDIVLGETAIGEKASLNSNFIFDRAAEWLTPFIVRDVVEAVKAHGPIGAALAAPGAFGAGTLTYGPSVNAELKIRFEQATGQKWDDLLQWERDQKIAEHPELAALLEQQQAQAEGPSADITRRKYDALSEISALAQSDPNAYRAQAGDIVARAAIEYEQAKRDGVLGDFESRGEAAKALDGYYETINKARNSLTGQVDYDLQDKLSDQYLASLAPEMRDRILNELTYSRDDTYRQYLEDRTAITATGFWDTSDQAFLRYRQQVAGSAQPGTIAYEARRFETWSEFYSFVEQEASKAAVDAGVPKEQLDYRVNIAVQRWFRDQKLYDARDFYRNQVIQENPAVVDLLRRWYPDTVTKSVLQTEQEAEKVAP